MATFTVTNLNDSGAGSLRDIISQANTTAGTDSIVFQAGLSGTITLTGGELLIEDSVSITGSGITIDGNDQSRIFYVYDSVSTLDVSFAGLTLTGGLTTDSGGAIASDGENITVTNAVITGNSAEGGGGISVEDGSLTIVNSQITDNTSLDYDDGAGILFSGNGASQNLSITNSTISGNLTFGEGGGIFAYLRDGSKMTVLSSEISGNRALDDDGGGISIQAYNSEVTIGNSTISGNTADYRGGGIFFRGFDGTTGTGNSLTIYNTDLLDNEANLGAIFADFNGSTVGAVNTFDLTDSLVADNIASFGSAGVVLLDDTVDGVVGNIQNSVVTGNDTLFPSEIYGYYGIDDGDGGGVIFGSSSGNGVLNIKDSVITDNNDNEGGSDLTNLENPITLIKGTINVTNSLIEKPTEGSINGTSTGLTTGSTANTVTLAVSPATVGEGGAALVYTFTRTGSTAQALTVSFDYSGTATLGTDFTQSGAASFADGIGTVTFAVGTTTATVTLTALADNTLEGSETVELVLSSEGYYLVGEASESSGTIVDNATTGATLPAIDFSSKKNKKGIKDKGGNQDDELAGTGKDDTLRGKNGDDKINGKGGKDQIFGDSGDDDLKGGGGNDRMDGSTGNDSLIGGGGNDQMSGGDGNDTLIGQGGSDVIIGGLGSDTLSGGGEVDTFVFNSLAEGIDTITDFNGDLIDLRGILSGGQYSATNNFQKFDQYVDLAQVGANTELRIDSDGSGSGTTFTTIALLTNVTATSLNASNFIVA